MTTFTVTTDCGTEREFENRADATEGIRTHESLCPNCDTDDIEMDVATDGSGASPSDLEGDGPERRGPEREGPESEGPESEGPESEGPEREPTEAELAAALPDEMPPSVRTDPLDVIPEYMIDYVEGQPAINKRGYAVIANRFDVVVQSEAITTAGETDHEYAEFKATAWTEGDGPESGYTGHATAMADEDRRGMESNLNEMAETRAMKRAVAWATGVGIVAWEEMVDYLDE